MRLAAALILSGVIFSPIGGSSQERPRVTSLIELIATPEKLEGQLITVRGFLLVLGQEHDITGYSLCLHREDAENELANEVQVNPNDQMLKDREKIDRVYVILTGTVRGFRSANGAYVAVIRDVRSCRPWSNPNHPILLKNDSEKKDK